MRHAAQPYPTELSQLLPDGRTLAVHGFEACARFVSRVSHNAVTKSGDLKAKGLQVELKHDKVSFFPGFASASGTGEYPDGALAQPVRATES